MAGNSQRKGATRRPGSKKGPTAGSGGRKAKGLEPRKATPRAEERTGHPASRKAASAARRDAPSGKRGAAPGRAPAPGRGAGSSRPGPSRGGGAKSGRGAKEPAELVVGRNSVLEALRAGVPAGLLYVAERIETDDRVKEALKLAVGAGVPLLEVPRPELDRLTQRAFHQGLALQVPPYTYAHPDDLLARAARNRRSPLVVALDGVTDPRNLGAVVRSADAFGAHGVLVPERRAAGMTAGAWKSSAGAAARLPVARAVNLTRALVAYKKAGLMIVSLEADGDVALSDFTMATDPVCLVIGSEGKGVSRLVGETVDLRLRIPMAGDAESLNAGVAAGIALYEIARQRTRS
jgi:23S rRNA (guanosine2251-2'-O)-methyltransferase